MEATGLLVKNHGDALYLEVLTSILLSLTHDLLSDFIGLLLSLVWVVLSDILALVHDNLIDDLLDLSLNSLELIFLGSLRFSCLHFATIINILFIISRSI